MNIIFNKLVIHDIFHRQLNSGWAKITEEASTDSSSCMLSVDPLAKDDFAYNSSNCL